MSWRHRGPTEGGRLCMSSTECLSRNLNTSCVLELFVDCYTYSRLKAMALGHHDDFTIITGRCQPWASTLWPSCYGTSV